MTNRQRAKWYIRSGTCMQIVAVLILVFILGCPPSQTTEQEAAQMEEDLQSLVGKKIIAVSSSNPMTIHVEGGGKIEFHCPRTPVVTVKPVKE